MADENTPVVIPPDKPKTQRIKVYEVWKAMETLAKTDIDPARQQSLMDDFHVVCNRREPGARAQLPNRAQGALEAT